MLTSAGRGPVGAAPVDDQPRDPPQRDRFGIPGGSGRARPIARPSGPRRASSTPTLPCSPRFCDAWSSGTVPSRSRAGYGRTSPRIRRCGCHTRRSIRPCTSSPAGNSRSRSRPRYGPEEHDESLRAARKPPIAAGSRTWSTSPTGPPRPTIGPSPGGGDGRSSSRNRICGFTGKP